MPDAIQLIETDHRNVEELFERFEAEHDPRIARQICQELTLHADMEEALLYPIVREDISTDLAEEAEAEHQEARELIREIESLDGLDAERLSELMAELKSDVQHHVEEEESQLLPDVREALGSEVDELGQAIEEFKAERHETLDLTKEELYEQARKQDVEGRSKMDKDELADAVEERGTRRS